MLRLLLGLCALLFVLPAYAATYYIAPRGADSNPGTSESAPWGTFAVLTRLQAGDTLLVMDGRYTVQEHGNGQSMGGGPGIFGVDCAAGWAHGRVDAPVVIKAQHERQAELHGAGYIVVGVSNCQYWTLEGLTITNTDDASSGGFDSTGIYTHDTRHLTLRRNLLYNPTNAAAGHNAQGIIIDGGGEALIEENEVYGACRHGIESRYSDGDVRRRNFVHGRNRPALCGNYYNYPGTSECLSVYPARNAITENNIAEDCVSAYTGHGIDTADNNRWYGNIALRVTGGFMVGARGGYGDGYGGANTASQMPTNFVWEHNVVIGSGQYDTFYGFHCRSCKNGQVRNFTSINALPAVNSFGAPGAIVFDMGRSDLGENGDGAGSGSAERVLMVRTPQGTFGFDNYQAASAQTMVLEQVSGPPSPSGACHGVTMGPAEMGTCLIAPPAGSAAAKAGVGATVTHRYDNGTLTAVSLWDLKTSQFSGCGAIVPGLNDVAGQSCFDVHERLNVNANGCTVALTGTPPPTGATSPPQAKPLPRNLRVVRTR